MNQPLLETLKQARDALNIADDIIYNEYCGTGGFEPHTCTNEIANLNAAIEQLEKAEPAGVIICCEYTATLGKFKAIVHSDNPLGNGPIYAHPSTPQWQPIETAPLDGTKILVCDGKEVSIVFYGHDWKGMGNWCCGDAEEPEIYVAGFNPTHWMPIPAAPGEKK